MPISVVLLRLPGRLFENHDELKGVTYNGSGQEEYSISTSCDVGERLGGDRIAMATVGQYKTGAYGACEGPSGICCSVQVFNLRIITQDTGRTDGTRQGPPALEPGQNGAVEELLLPRHLSSFSKDR
jgi:hypothetical protein